jgi:hypothetical protein
MPVDIASIEHRDGIDWWEAPAPPRTHDHEWQTRAVVDGEVVERCRCGAFGDGEGDWMMLPPDKPRVIPDPPKPRPWWKFW